MQKYILTSILMINSALLMSQNIAQTNILINQSNQSNVSRGNWLLNESRSNTNKQTNRNIKVQQQSNRNIEVQQFNNKNVINTNDNVTQNRGRGNQNPTQSVVRNTNPIQVQRQTTNVQRGNVNIINEINPIEINIGNNANEDKSPILNNGNLQINTENVQNEQIQFLADNNDKNIQLLNPQINFEFNIEQQVQTNSVKVKTVTTSRPKEVKVKTFTPLELKPLNTRIRNSSSESTISETSIAKIKTEKAEKHKGGSSYSQSNKSYFGKKVKIWCKKNLKFAKKIRMSVSCPKF